MEKDFMPSLEGHKEQRGCHIYCMHLKATLLGKAKCKAK